MSIEELEAEALRLDPKARARLAGRLLDSLEQLSPEENARVWAGEAARRAEALERGTLTNRAADDVFRDARTHL
jgi:Putative addiction module component